MVDEMLPHLHSFDNMQYTECLYWQFLKAVTMIRVCILKTRCARQILTLWVLIQCMSMARGLGCVSSMSSFTKGT